MLAAQQRQDPNQLSSLIEKNLEIPTIPVVAQRAIKEMANPDVNVSHLTRILAEDQGLTARVLKVANSPLYAQAREVKNLQQAAMIVGLNTLRGIVVSVANRMIYKRFGKVEQAMWEHSVAVAVAAHTIAVKKKLPHRDESFVAGLMHDVGKVVMNNGARDAFAKSVQLAEEEGMDSIEAEHQVFGFSHVDVGGLLLERWSLSPRLGQAVFLHHDLELVSTVAEGNEDLVYATNLADKIAHVLQIGSLTAPKEDPEPVDLAEEESAAYFDLDTAAMADLVVQVKEIYEAQHQAMV